MTTYAICDETKASPFDTSMALRPIVAEGIQSKAAALEILIAQRQTKPTQRFALLKYAGNDVYFHESEHE